MQNSDLVRLVLEKSSSLEEARRFLADFVVMPATRSAGTQMRLVPNLSLANGTRWTEPVEPVEAVVQRASPKTAKASKPSTRANARRLWTDAEIELLRHMRVDKKMPVRLIAPALKRTKSAVRMRISLLGLPRVFPVPVGLIKAQAAKARMRNELNGAAH